jgi:aminoglycoside phosphotransferase (APT) family kinase protein
LPVLTVTVIVVSIPEIPAGVNPDELDLALDALRQLDAPRLRVNAPPARLGGGFWAEMWTLHLDNRGPLLPERVVLRLAPDPQLAAWETAVQHGVADQHYNTPAILTSGDATDTTRFWSVMEHATGQPLLAGLSGLGALAKLPRLARALPTQLASSMAALHALNAEPIEAELTAITGHPIGVDGILDHFTERAEHLADRTLTRTVEQLTRTQPAPDRRVVCHGDLHPFNILNHDGELTVLDWTAAQIGDPAYDVAFTALLLANPPLAAPAALAPIINGAARTLSRRFVRTYRAMTSTARFDNTSLAWHTKLHATRILLDITEWRNAGTLDQNQGHPWLVMESAVRHAIGQTIPAP